MGQRPNIVTVYDTVEDDGRPWIAMELLGGTSLHRLVSEQGPLEPERAWVQQTNWRGYAINSFDPF